MGFDKFYQCAIRVLDVRKMTCGLSHIKTIATVHGEWMAKLFAQFSHLIHTLDIKAKVDISQVAPKSVFKDLVRLIIQRLDQLYGSIAQ